MTVRRIRLPGKREVAWLAACTVLIAAVALTLVLPAQAEKPKVPDLRPQAIRIEALPVDFDPSRPELRSFGKLRWLGGVALQAKSPYFGGYSGLALNEAGTHLVAVSDGGHWLRARVTYSGRRIEGLTEARIGPLLARSGRPLSKRRNVDAEAVAAVRPGRIDGDLYISFERNHRIGQFPQTPGAIGAPKRYLTLPKTMKGARSNGGFEGLTVARSGRFKNRLIAFTERVHDEEGHHVGWVFAGRSRKLLRLKRLGGFDITDLAATPDGGLLVLERRFRLIEGVQMRIRRIAPDELRPGAPMTGEVLLHARGNLQIDNMEGLAVHRGRNGAIVITLISDDNFNRVLQRTLLLQFALPPDG